MLKLERIYIRPFDLNGKRVLIDRLWPRGLSKADAQLDYWAKDVAPSTSLRNWFQHDNHKYSEFKQRYLTELANNLATENLLNYITKWSSNHDVIILYGAKNTTHNNAVVLTQFLANQLNVKVDDYINDFANFYYNDGATNSSKKLPQDIKWLKNHASICNKFNLKLDEQHDHIALNGKNLSHVDLFNLILAKSNS